MMCIQTDKPDTFNIEKLITQCGLLWTAKADLSRAAIEKSRTDGGRSRMTFSRLGIFSWERRQQGFGLGYSVLERHWTRTQNHGVRNKWLRCIGEMLQGVAFGKAARKHPHG